MVRAAISIGVMNEEREKSKGQLLLTVVEVTGLKLPRRGFRKAVVRQVFAEAQLSERLCQQTTAVDASDPKHIQWNGARSLLRFRCHIRVD